MNLFTIGIVFLLCSHSLLAQTSTADALIADLSLCDATFFRTLNAHESTLRSHDPLESRGNIAYRKIVDREEDDKNVVMINKSIDGKGELVGYFDELIDLELLGKYYDWDFSRKAVQSALQRR